MIPYPCNLYGIYLQAGFFNHTDYITLSNDLNRLAYLLTNINITRVTQSASQSLSTVLLSAGVNAIINLLPEQVKSGDGSLISSLENGEDLVVTFKNIFNQVKKCVDFLSYLYVSDLQGRVNDLLCVCCVCILSFTIDF